LVQPVRRGEGGVERLPRLRRRTGLVALDHPPDLGDSREHEQRHRPRAAADDQVDRLREQAWPAAGRMPCPGYRPVRRLT
ncbi:MAG TPA: hypothetical protein VHT95_07035, partial [Vicinamibacterales bacterium]|nr:hypothetical protein [Vicinamibacterales bacterium]